MDNVLHFPPSVMLKGDDLQTETSYNRKSATIEYPADATTEDQMNIVEASGTLDFWNHPEEDVYGETDGDGA